MFCRFVHFGVFCLAKYRYGENSAANPNFKKIALTLQKSRYQFKKYQEHFSTKKFAFLGENPLSWQPWYKQMSLARPDDFSTYENCLKRIVYTLVPDFPYGEKSTVTGKNFLPVPAKYREMHETANPIFFNFQNKKRKFD
jgi:hypothetical protein